MKIETPTLSSTSWLRLTPATIARKAWASPSPRSGHGAAVVVDDLEKRYGERLVLRRMSLTIEPGSFVAIVGRSGCGKSTLLRTVAGLETPTAGSVAIQPRTPLTGIAKKAEVRTRIMFQESRLLPWKSVMDNVRIGEPRPSPEQAKATLEEVGLADRAGEWPSQLSGGQRQRVALARALVQKPDVLLLDEPLGALDALTRIEMHALIERLWLERQFTALLVTHDVGEAVALADRIIVIEHGDIALDIPVNLPRPRARGSAAFAALEDRVLRQVLQLPAAEEAEAVYVETDASIPDL